MAKSDIHTWIYPWIYPWISISTATLINYLTYIFTLYMSIFESTMR